MGLEDYLDFGLGQLNLESAGAGSIGTVRLLDSDAVVDVCISDRIGFMMGVIANIYDKHGPEQTYLAERDYQLITFEQYMATLRSVDGIRLKIAEATQPIPSQRGRSGNPTEDKYVAKVIEKKTGYNPTADWKKADKIIEAQHKLYNQYDEVTLKLAEAYNPHLHTPDRAGYFRFLQGQASDLIEVLQEHILVAPLLGELRRHAYITGGSGSGKTELLKQLIHAAFHRYGEAVIVIDPHGDLAEQVAKWEMFETDGRLLYIDPYLSPDHIPPFNPLQVPEGTTMQQKEVIAQQLVNAFEQLLKGSGGDSLTVNMRTVLMPCLLTLIDRPGSTLADLQRFMNDRLNEDLVQVGKTSKRRAIRDFFTYDFQDDTSLRPSKSAISRKLQSLLNTFAFDEMVNSPQTLDLEQAISEGRIILFNLSKGRYGG